MPGLLKRHRVCGALLFVMAAGWAWTLAAQEKAGEKPAIRAAERPKAKATGESPEMADPFAVPEGTPEELLKYIDGLKKLRPTSESQDAVMEFIKKRSQALLAAAEKVLAGKPNPEQAKSSVQYKLLALNMLNRLGDPEATKKLEAFPAQLEKAGLKDLVWQVRCSLLEGRLRGVPQMSDEDFNKLLDEVRECIKESQLDRAAAGLAMDTAMSAEYAERGDRAIKVYREFGKLLADAKDKSVAGLGATMQGAARRLGLVGKKFTLEGTTVEGKPLNWNKYKGKVVLVDFWATWCGPCRAEMPNIEKNYQDYHDRGFDVIGVSVDQDRKALDEFLAGNKHPWTILHDNTEGRGTDKSLSTYYGIIGIPQMILVGRDGNVVSLNARGEELGKVLEKLLGPVEDKRETPAKETGREGPAKSGKKAS